MTARSLDHTPPAERETIARGLPPPDRALTEAAAAAVRFTTPQSTGQLLALQRTAGNQAVAHALGRPSVGSPTIQRSPPTEAPAPGLSLDDRYRAALATARQTGDFGLAAELLNGFGSPDIFDRLAALTDEEVGYLHLGAVNNPAVGPQSQVAQLTAPGAPRASTVGPTSSRAPARGPVEAPPGPSGSADKDAAIAAMTPTDRLIEAFDRAPIDSAFRQKIASMITPDALIAAILTFAAVFVASQFTPVGWAADITLGLSMLFVGTALIKATGYLIDFAAARTATTSAQIDAAAQAFAKAVAEIGVDGLLFLITKGAGGAGRGGGPPIPPAGNVVLAMRGDQLVMVSAATVPAAVATEWGILGAGTVMAMTGEPGDGDFDDEDPEVAKWEKKFAGKPRKQRISDAKKQELEDSGWLKKKLPDADRRREFMKWLEKRHGSREGVDHEHVPPGSPEAQQALDEFLLESP